MKRTKSKPTKRHEKLGPSQVPSQKKLPFIAHVQELRKRLFIIAIAISIGAGAAYGIQMQLTAWLLKPAGSQQFIYTTPGGGIDFLFKLCLYTGVAFAIPVIVYQLLRYLQPLIKKNATRFIVRGSLASGVLAICGIAFGYFVGLPASMHFLLNQFTTTKQIEALLSIQSYLSFVMVYLLGSALLFQVPLIMVLINKAKPLKPRKLMGFQRWFIVFAFIVGAIINPSPNIQDQLLLSVPMILMYQLGIVLVWLINRRGNRSRKVQELMQKDAEIRAARLNNFQQAQETWLKAVATTLKPAAPPARKPVTTTSVRASYPVATPPSRASIPTPAPKPKTIHNQAAKPIVVTPASPPPVAPPTPTQAEPVHVQSIRIPISVDEPTPSHQPALATPGYKNIAISFRD